MADETSRSRGTGITIKYGKGYEETWATFTGSNAEVRADILSYFGIDADVTKDLTTSEVVVKATQVAHAKGNAAAVLGAFPVSSEKAKAAETAEDKSDPWAEDGDSSTPAKVEAPDVFAQIEATTSVQELKLWWTNNQAAFEDAAVKAAYNAKGKALQAAAKAAA